MSDFDKKTLSYVEKLAKIKLTSEEEESFSNALKSIIDYVEQLDQIDTTNVESSEFILLDLQKNIFREDEAENTLATETFLKNCPDVIASMVKVPPIIEQN